MFWLHSLGDGTIKVFDTDDFSVEILPERDTMQFISSNRLKSATVDNDFEVVSNGDYALLYSNVKFGSKVRMNGKLFKRGLINHYGVVSVNMSGSVSANLSPFMLGCKVDLLTVVNGIRYSCYRKFDAQLNLVDSSSWVRVNRG